VRRILAIVTLILIVTVLTTAAWYVFFTTSGLTRLSSRYCESLPAGSITAASIKGNIAFGAVYRNLEVGAIQALPGAVLRIQELQVRLKGPGRADLNVTNARLELETGEVISFAGSYRSGKLRFNVYSGFLYIQSLRKTLAAFGIDFLRSIEGRINGLDIYVSNTPEEVQIKGTLLLEQAFFQNFSAENFPVRADLRWLRHGRQGLLGTVSAASGSMVTKKARMELKASQCEFTGDPSNPRLKFSGSATVGETSIHCFLTGTLASPELQLTSQPPMPQDRLLVMLVTGQSWQNTANALSQGKLTPGIIKDFADFLLFGGSQDSLEKKLGITGIAINYGRQEKGIEVHKAITGKTDVIYGVQKNATEQADAGDIGQRPRTSQTVGLEYKLNGNLSLEGKRQPAQDRVEREDLIQLKFKKSF
jgi:hypothetical protein